MQKNVVEAFWTVIAVVCYQFFAEGARRFGLRHLFVYWFHCHFFYLINVFFRNLSLVRFYLSFVLRPKDDYGPIVSESFKFSAHSFDYSCSQYVGGMCRKLDNVFCDLVQKQSRIKVLLCLRYSLDGYDIRMKNRQLLFKLKRNWHISFLDVLVRLE